MFQKIYYRFYLECGSRATKRAGVHNGNVVALKCHKVKGILAPIKAHEGSSINNMAALYYAIVAIDSQHPNNRVRDTTVCLDYLRNYCKRTSREEAKRIHPELFKEIAASTMRLDPALCLR